MPHGDYRDFEDRGTPFNTNLASEQGVNGGGGYSVPLAAAQTVGGYKSTAVTVDGNGTDVSVEVGWTMTDDVAGIVAKETKSGGGSIPTTLLFVNQGDVLDHVTLTGGANIDYSVTESNQLPLARSATTVYPSHQHISLPAQFEFGYGGGVGHALVVDALCFHNFYYETTAQDSFIAFYFLMGPRYARHEVIFTGLKGPNLGIQRYLLASILPDVQASEGYDNPLELMQNPSTGTPAPTFVDIGANVDRYQAAIGRNITWGINFRVEGADGAELTTVALDSDNFHGVDGGPGLYMLKILMDTKNGLSAGYRARWNAIDVHRIGDSGFP